MYPTMRASAVNFTYQERTVSKETELIQYDSKKIQTHASGTPLGVIRRRDCQAARGALARQDGLA